MRKILIILITFPLIFNSCKKEEDDINNNTSSIIGTWQLEDYTETITTGYIDPAFLTEIVLETESYTMNSNPLNLFWVYRDNGSFSRYYFNNDTLEQYDHYDYVKNVDENGDAITWTLDSNDLVTFTVTSLTSNNLNVFSWYGHQVTINDDTTSFLTVESSLFFIKSQLPGFTTELLNKKKPVSGYNSFLNRRKNR